MIAGIHTSRKQLERASLNYQKHLLIVAQDIDETVALMCYIQLSLFGVAGYVTVGNSLTEPMTDNDKDVYKRQMENDEEYDALYPTRDQICDD